MRLEHSTPFIPTLALALALAGTVAHAAPDRLALTMDKEPNGDVRLAWQDACLRGGTDYGVHEGSLGDFTSHGSLQCTTGGASTATITPSTSDIYYLVVPLDDGAEGSYGLDSDGNERGVGVATCLPQQSLQACFGDSFVDADPTRVARLDAVLDAAVAIIEGGGSWTDVANMLALEADVEGVFSDGVSMYFTVDGLPTSIYDTEAARHNGPLQDVIPPQGGAAPPSRAPSAPTSGIGSLRSAAQAEPDLPRGQRMVGDDDDGDGRRDLPKFALVLAPWKFDFGSDAVAPVVASILEGVRDYQGNVIFKKNDQDLLTDTLTLADYTDGWQDQDIIFLSSHGSEHPLAYWGPEPVVLLGIGGASCAEIAARIAAEQPDPGRRPGLHCSMTIDIGASPMVIAGRDTVATPTFWTAAHPGGLDKKLIFIDTCKGAAKSGIALALTGTDSVFLGWSGSVDLSTSLAWAPAVIRETVEDGFPVLRAFVRECVSGQCRNDVTSSPAELLAGWDRADLRTREALSVPATPGYGFCGLSFTLPVEQTCPSCGGGAGLSVDFSFTVDGVEPHEMTMFTDPQEFAWYQLRMFADQDGVESGYALPLTDMSTTPLGNGVWSDTLPFTLGMNDVCPYQSVTYDPWILLPAFDETTPGNDGRDRMYSWDGPFTIFVDPVVLP